MRIPAGFFSITAAVALLVACGGAKSGSLPQGVVQAQSRAHRASGSSGELVYVTTKNGVAMLSYPDGTLVGMIPWYFDNGELCSDPSNGNVYIPEGGSIYEYAHGGTTPIVTLSLPSGITVTGGCSVDPTTGDVAQIGWTVIKGSSRTVLLVFSQSSNSPKEIVSSKLPGLGYPAYDNSGNLFIGADAKEGAFRIGELKPGASEFTIIMISALNREPGVTVDLCPNGLRRRSTHAQEPFYRGADRRDSQGVRCRDAG